MATRHAGRLAKGVGAALIVDVSGTAACFGVGVAFGYSTRDLLVPAAFIFVFIAVGFALSPTRVKYATPSPRETPSSAAERETGSGLRELWTHDSRSGWFLGALTAIVIAIWLVARLR